MKKTLEQILFDYKEIEKELLENEGEIDESLEERLNINRNELNDKIDGYYYVSENLKAQAEFDKSQEERFAKRKKAKLNAAQRLKDRIDEAVEKYGVENIKSKGRIKSLIVETENLRATGVPYPILDPTTLPDSEHLQELPEKYLDYIANIKTSPKDAKELMFILGKYNAKHPEAPLIVPEFKPYLNSTLLKSDILEGIEVGDIKISNNYKTRFS